MLEAICVTESNKGYINKYLATAIPRKTIRVDPGTLLEGRYVVIRKNDVVIWKPAFFHSNYEFIFDGEAKYFYFSSIRLRRTNETKFCGDIMPHNTHSVTTGQKRYWCHGPTSIDVEWDVDINLPMYTRDYIRLNKTPHSPKEADDA